MRKAAGIILVMASLLGPPAFAGLYGKTICKFPGFTCVKVKRNQSWQSMFPDEHDRDIVMRINRMNTDVYQGLVIAVPNDLSDADILNFAPFPNRIEGEKEKMVIVDPVNLAWAAYSEDGALVRWGPISAGADYCRDIEKPCHTHAGSFRVFSMGSSDCYSTKFPLPNGGAPMPYCMYFNNGQALHGEPNGLPGYNASHGCVRMYVNDAEWLRYDFVEAPNENNNYRGTLVMVKPYYIETGKKGARKPQYEDDQPQQEDEGDWGN